MIQTQLELAKERRPNHEMPDIDITQDDIPNSDPGISPF